MKISKLFHWLYATLMFLPLVFFIPSVFYYGFNEHATNSETTTINYKYQSNEVNSIDDLVEGNIYYLDTFNFSYDNLADFEFDFYIISIGNAEISVINSNLLGYDFYSNEQTCLNFYSEGNGILEVYSFNFDTNSQVSIAFTLSNLEYLKFNDVIFIYKNMSDEIDWLDNYAHLPQYTDYNVIESVSVNTDDTITDKLNRSWNAIFDLPMFSWTKTTFVSAPFTYITGLFGLANDNPINYLFGYFASISICWLVFDLVLYVPNIAHRWLDRSALE